ncbi:MATE family efflux transporter [Primorskyibacter sedentarius]|uniref:MATE family efflux transporter n=1 Tax=Primorskyibacter sedentarius TaxID=745311 RepID=UPI003EC09D5B
MVQAMTLPQHIRAILFLGLPLIGGHLAQFAIGLTDTLMLGWYSVEALAAATLANTLFFVLFIMGAGFAWAVMPMVAQFHAKGDDVMIRRTTRMGIWLSLGFAVLVLPLLWFSAPVLRGLGQSDSLSAAAQSYLRIAGIGLIPALSVMALKSYLAALEHTRIVFWITAFAAILNALINYALIFGNWGAPEMGLLGAAVASAITNVIALLGVMVYISLRLPEHALFTRFWRPDTEVLTTVFRLGWPISLTNLAEVALFASSAIMMGWLGEVPLAAHGIVLQLATAAFMVHLGLSNVATVRAGNALGREDMAHLLRGAAAVGGLSVAMSLVTVSVFLLMPEVLVSAFIDPTDMRYGAILAAGVSLLAMAALFQLVDGAQVVALGLLRGIQDTQVPMIMAAVAYWVIGVPISYLLGFTLGFGGPGVWLGLVLGLACAALLMVVRFALKMRALLQG